MFFITFHDQEQAEKADEMEYVQEIVCLMGQAIPSKIPSSFDAVEKPIAKTW